MGGYKYRVFLRKRPGLQNGVRLQGVSAYRGCPLGGVRLYRHADDGVFDDFPKISDHLPKIFQNCTEYQTSVFRNIFQEFPRISEDFRRLPKTFEEDPKKFR